MRPSNPPIPQFCFERWADRDRLGSELGARAFDCLMYEQNPCYDVVDMLVARMDVPWLPTFWWVDRAWVTHAEPRSLLLVSCYTDGASDGEPQDFVTAGLPPAYVRR